MNFWVYRVYSLAFFFFFNETATTEIYTLSLHDALPIGAPTRRPPMPPTRRLGAPPAVAGPRVMRQLAGPTRRSVRCVCGAGRIVERQMSASASHLHPRPRHEELHRTAAGEPGPELCAGLTKELAEHLFGGGDRVHQVGEVLAVLDQRV